MRTTVVCFANLGVIVGVVLGSIAPVYADNTTVYLPLIASDQKPTHFQLISVRLWTPTENGHVPGSADLCGEQHVLQVHVFDTCGDCGEASRLHGAGVLVLHTTNDGNSTSEIVQTGADGTAAGVAQFDLQTRAQIWIASDASGETATSDTTRVTTQVGEISFHDLMSAGYCSDNASCGQFAASSNCNGHFSWTVAFKMVK